MSNTQTNITDISIEQLLDIAKKYLKFSYSPYSKIRVVAVLLTDIGTYVGVNIENASYGLTMCAERVAIYKAVSEGSKKFYLMFIYSPDIIPYPCGACRQVMAEFFDANTKIIVSDGKAHTEFTMTDLLPYTFTLKTKKSPDK